MNTTTTTITAFRLVLSLFLVALLVIPATGQDTEFQQYSAVRFTSSPGYSNSVHTAGTLESIIMEIKLLENIPVQTPNLSRVQWNDFADRLEEALDTDHRGLNHAALRLVIAYGDHFKLDEDAVFDVMRIYRNDYSERARRMAVVALAEMNSNWAIRFLERSSRFEKSKTVKQTILAVLAAQKRDARVL